MKMDNKDKFKSEIQNRNLENLFDLGGLRVTDTFFPYTSGQIGPYIIRSEVIKEDDDKYDTAISDMLEVIRRDIGLGSFDVISGGESRDWIFSIPVADKLGLPHASLYKSRFILGYDINEKRVLHVADLNNTGSSARDLWVPTIRENGGTINDIFFLCGQIRRRS